jgi:hypothetical protein
MLLATVLSALVMLPPSRVRAAMATGEDPPTVMAEMGHSSPQLALRIYAQAMRLDQGEKARLRALVDGVELALIGTPSEVPDEMAAGCGAV